MTARRSRRALAVAVAVLASAALSGCGTRVSRAEVVAGAGGGPVTLSSTQAAGNTGPLSSSGSSDNTGAAGATSAPTAVPGGSAPTAVAGGQAVAGPAAAASTAASTGAGGSGGTGGSRATTGAGGSNGSGNTSAKAGGAGASSSAAAPAPGQPCTKQGPPIVYGQVGTFSGLIGASESAAQWGLKVWAAATNAAGGIACHPVQVVSIDDAGDTGKAQSAIQTLVQSDHAIAVNAYVPITLNGIESYVDSNKVPVVGGDMLDPKWYSDPYLFPQGSTFDAGMFSFLNFAHQKGANKLAVLYCIEASPCAIFEHDLNTGGIAQQAGVPVVYNAPITLGGSNFVQQCSAAKAAGANALAIGAGATAAVAIARDCANQNYHPIFVTISLAVNSSVGQDPNLNGLIISNPQFPWTQADNPAQRAYQAAIKTYASNQVNAGSAAGAWTSGEMLKKAIGNLGSAAYGNLTSAMVTQGLQMMRNETLGGLSPNYINFHAGAGASPSKCAFISQVQNGAWVAPIGSQQLCAP